MHPKIAAMRAALTIAQARLALANDTALRAYGLSPVPLATMRRCASSARRWRKACCRIQRIIELYTRALTMCGVQS